ncbi:MAG TPA: RimK family alpha-L-glutamate ligase, partial [Lamprocystis sp. (in: g-proteobacteria)]|nr:RimK family alpha-L-glutamate ligase [Lamprocystis sp. (in: g-proteobacteria)]
WEARYVSLAACHFALGDGGPGLCLPGCDGLPDAAFVRGVPGGTLEEVVYYLDVLHALRHLGIAVYNDGRAIERSVDKGMTSFLLHTAGIPTPPAWVIRDSGRARQVVERELAAGHELVCKPLFGSQGEGLIRLTTATSALPDPVVYHGIHYLQRYVPGATGTAQDWRVFVIGGRAVAAMRRTAATGWITNVAQGAACHPATLEPDLRELAQAAARTLEMAYAGVDILRDTAGRAWVIEVNGVPAWKGLQQVCGCDIAAALVRDLLRRYQGAPRMEAVG